MTKRRNGATAVLSIVLAGMIWPGVSASSAQAQAASAPAPATATNNATPGVLKAADLSSLFPPQVFYRGQSASVQMRNSGGIRYSDGMLTMAALVDTSGYSTGVQQRYQAYLLTEVPLRIGGASGRTLQPGAYGVGFVENNRFIVMDIGDHELLSVTCTQDAALHRPTPLQVMEAPEKGSYRLYAGRKYVTLARTK